jgi:DNA polymerase-3 subunit epsilon
VYGHPGPRSGFAVVDVETTGFDPAEQRIVEIGVVILDDDGRELSAFSTLVDPGCDPGPTHVHGISSPMLTGAPCFAAIHPYVADQLTGRVMVGHNVDGFDQAFLESECRRVGGDEMAPRNVATLDTLVIAQEQLGLEGRAKLVDCCEHFGLTWIDHHSALGDARVTAELFRRMRDNLGDDAIGIPSALNAAVGSFWPGASGELPAVTVRSDYVMSGPDDPHGRVVRALRRLMPWPFRGVGRNRQGFDD